MKAKTSQSNLYINHSFIDTGHQKLFPHEEKSLYTEGKAPKTGACEEEDMGDQVVEESSNFSDLQRVGMGSPAAEGPELVVSAPPMQLQYSSPSLSDKPLLIVENPDVAKRRETHPLTPYLTPFGTPFIRAIQMTKFDPQDAWLPITESRNGNAFYAAFHTLCSGIGIQALVLPVSFTILGWTWGIICLTIAFIWQTYTLWVLVKLHECPTTGVRYSRYLHICQATFAGAHIFSPNVFYWRGHHHNQPHGPSQTGYITMWGNKVGKLMALFPIMYLSGGTCVALIIVGGSTLKLFFEIICGHSCTTKPLTTVEWYLVFTCAAVVLSQLPNLNSIAGVSLIGAATAIGYCTIMWLVAVTEGRLEGVSYKPVRPVKNVALVFGFLNALGIIAFAFRGHNLILEIQATMPSSEKRKTYVPMWRGVQVAYLIIALCLFPLAIGGYWAYGHKIPENGGMLTAIYAYHGKDTSQFVLALTSLLVIINAVSSFQIYGMPMFDDMESKYTKRKNKPCPWWLRALFRTMFGYGCFFVAVAIPFLGSFAGLIGGIAVPVTFAYPCFLWLKIKKPTKYSMMWALNWFLGASGMVLTVLLIAAGVYVVIDTGIEVSFFKP